MKSVILKMLSEFFDLIDCLFSKGSFNFDGGSDHIGDSSLCRLCLSSYRAWTCFCYSIFLWIIILAFVRSDTISRMFF
jgi:hypothetical protein